MYAVIEDLAGVEMIADDFVIVGCGDSTVIQSKERLRITTRT